MNLIEIKDLTKSYGKKEALKNINLTIEPGKIYGLWFPHVHAEEQFTSRKRYVAFRLFH